MVISKKEISKTTWASHNTLFHNSQNTNTLIKSKSGNWTCTTRPVASF